MIIEEINICYPSYTHCTSIKTVKPQVWNDVGHDPIHKNMKLELLSWGSTQDPSTIQVTVCLHVCHDPDLWPLSA